MRRLCVLLVILAVVVPLGSAEAVEPVDRAVTVTALIPPLTVTSLTYAPQPFDPTAGVATIGFELSRPADTVVTLRDMGGAVVRVLTTPDQPAGVSSVLWDGLNMAGTMVPPSWYSCTVSAAAGPESAEAIQTIAVSYGKPLQLTAAGVRPASIVPPAVATIVVRLTRDSYVGVSITAPDGSQVRERLPAFCFAGTTSYDWNGTDASGQSVVPGQYKCTMTGYDSGGSVASVSQRVVVQKPRKR